MYQLPPWIWPSALMAVCAIAVWRGRDEERLAAAGLLANWALSLMVFKSRSEDTQWAVFLLDAGFWSILLWIAFRTRRFWPLFAAGFQLLVIVTHLGHAIDPAVSGWAYLTAQLVFSYLILGAIGYGAWTAPRHAEMDAEELALNEAPGAIRR
jgi:hypothetical protein